MTRDELIRKMLDAWFDFDRFDMSTVEGQRQRMAATLDVMLAEVLKSPDDNELFASSDNPEKHPWWGLDYERARRIFSSRLAKYAKVKTPEERIKLVRIDHNRASVLIDGQLAEGCPIDGLSYHGANVFSLGLIAQLKAGQQ